MRYLPLNTHDRAQMLDVIGVENIDAIKASRRSSAI